MGRRLHFDIEIRGVVYPTTRAAAKALGVTFDAVLKARQAGTLHRVGTGRGGVEPSPVRIRGRTYPDAAAAARAHGVSPSAVRRAVREGDPDRVGRARGWPLRGAAIGRSVTVGGLTFSSMAEASRQLGFSETYVSRAMRKNSKAMQERLVGAAMALRAKREAEARQKREKAGRLAA